MVVLSPSLRLTFALFCLLEQIIPRCAVRQADDEVRRVEQQIEQAIADEKRRRKIFEATLTVRVLKPHCIGLHVVIDFCIAMTDGRRSGNCQSQCQ